MEKIYWLHINPDNKQIISSKLSLLTNYRKINIFRFNGNYKSRVKRKISEALYIKALKLTLNIEKNSIGLGLYNWFNGCSFAIKHLKKFDFRWFFLSFNSPILYLLYSLVLNTKNFRILYIHLESFGWISCGILFLINKVYFEIKASRYLSCF